MNLQRHGLECVRLGAISCRSKCPVSPGPWTSQSGSGDLNRYSRCGGFGEQENRKLVGVACVQSAGDGVGELRGSGKLAGLGACVQSAGGELREPKSGGGLGVCVQCGGGGLAEAACVERGGGMLVTAACVQCGGGGLAEGDLLARPCSGGFASTGFALSRRRCLLRSLENHFVTSGIGIPVQEASRVLVLTHGKGDSACRVSQARNTEIELAVHIPDTFCSLWACYL